MPDNSLPHRPRRTGTQLVVATQFRSRPFHLPGVPFTLDLKAKGSRTSMNAHIRKKPGQESGKRPHQDPRHESREKPSCTVTPVPQIDGERRTYRGLAQPFSAHAHEHYVIGRVEEGSRELDLNGKRMLIGAGDLIAFNPGDVHGCRHASDELFAYDSVTIAAEMLDGAHLRFPTGECAEAQRAYDDLLLSIEAEREEDVLDRALYLASCLDAELGAEFDAEEGPPAASSAHNDSALRVFAHLRGHLARPRSVSELAAMEGISEYALIRAYRRHFSITPLQHLMSLRVECACELLAEGAAPADVAAEVGFADQAHLTRVFKQRIGTTPAAYRKMAGKGSCRR